METLYLDSIYWGFPSKNNLVEKIYRYICDTYERDDEKEDYSNDGWPEWTFSGSPNGDNLTSYVQECLESDNYSFAENICFLEENDFLNKYLEKANEIAENIELT